MGAVVFGENKWISKTLKNGQLKKGLPTTIAWVISQKGRRDPLSTGSSGEIIERPSDWEEGPEAAWAPPNGSQRED